MLPGGRGARAHVGQASLGFVGRLVGRGRKVMMVMVMMRMLMRMMTRMVVLMMIMMMNDE